MHNGPGGMFNNYPGLSGLRLSSSISTLDFAYSLDLLTLYTRLSALTFVLSVYTLIIRHPAPQSPSGGDNDTHDHLRGKVQTHHVDALLASQRVQARSTSVPWVDSKLREYSLHSHGSRPYNLSLSL